MDKNAQFTYILFLFQPMFINNSNNNYKATMAYINRINRINNVHRNKKQREYFVWFWHMTEILTKH